MVKIYLSDRLKHIFYIQYSGEVTSEDDQTFINNTLVPFFKTRTNIHLVMEYLPSTLICDKDFFNSSGLGLYDVNRELTILTSFGLVGIQKSFIRKYYQDMTYKKLEFNLFDTRKEFETNYKVNFKIDFKEVFSQ